MDKSIQYNFNDLRAKDFISLSDGKNLGRISDAVISYPEYKINGFYVREKCFCWFSKNELYVPVSSIVKIGEDAILCDLEKRNEKPKKPKLPCCGHGERRDFDEYE